jgi:hypothetical protein
MNQKNILIMALSLIVIGGLQVADADQNVNMDPYQGPPGTSINLTNENPTINGQVYPAPQYFGPEVYPNLNPGDPGMSDDQDQIWRQNKEK